MHNIEGSINKENGVHQDVVDALIKSPGGKLKELGLNNAQLKAENENGEEEKIKTIKKNIKDIITRVSNNPKIRNEILHQTNMKQVLLLLCKNKTYENKIRELRGKDKKDKNLFDTIFKNTYKKIINQVKTYIEKHKKINIEKKDVDDFCNKIKKGEIIVSGEGFKHTLTIENLNYAIQNKQPLPIERNGDRKLKRFSNSEKIYHNFPKFDTEAIDYESELPRNFNERQTELKTGSEELTQIITKNAATIAPIIGRKPEYIHEGNIRELRALLLTDETKFKEVTRRINFNKEIKALGKVEKQNDTQNYITTLNQRYNINIKPLEGIKDTTGIGATLLYYKKNKNNPKAKNFCKEFEENIKPQLEGKFNGIIGKYKDKLVIITIHNFEDLINNIDNSKLKGQDNDNEILNNIFSELGNTLNENNKTEALKRQDMTKESIYIGNSLANVFESTSKGPKTPKEKETMRKVLRGVHFQKEVGNKMQQLMGNPKLSNFFAKHPNLRSFTLEDLAKFDGSDPAQKLLIQLVANTFVSKKALDSYQHNLIDTNKLDDVNAITETVDQVFEEALNDENLFKDFENESINLDDEKYQGIIDITGDKTINYGELLDEFDKKHQNLSKSIEEYTEDHDPTSDRETLWEDHAKESLITKLNNLSKKYQEKLHIDLGLNTILKREDLNLNEKNTVHLPFDRSEVERRLHGNRLKMSDHLKQKIENKIKKLIGKEQEKKKNYIENSDSSLNKLIITNRVQTTINMLQSYPFTKGLNLNVDDPQSILIDKDLNITLQGNYEGKPCQLCINANGEVKTTVYYEYSHTDEQITFNNSPNFTLFTLPSLKEQREIGLQTLKEKNAREEVSQQFKEQIKVNPKGIDNFPREKEKGLCLLKIKELTRGTEIMTNKATPQKYQFFKEMEESIKNAEDANRIKRILSRFEKAIHQMHHGATFIEENSQIFHTLFNKTTLEKQKNNANNETKFDENSYVILLRHFMREEGGTKTLRIDDMVAFIKAFSEGGDTAIKKQEAKILGQATGEQDSQYRAYQNTKLAELLKKTLEQKESKGPKG